MSDPKLPAWGQLLLPLVDTLKESGPTKAKDTCSLMAERLRLHPDVRNAIGQDALGRKFNLLDRRIRWVKQTAQGKGLIHSPKKGIWELTELGEKIATGKNELGTIQRGLVVTLFSTPNGKFLWGHAEDIAAEIENGSVDLIFTSPPYPLLRKKEYGNLNGDSYLDWLEDILGIHLEKLSPNGAFLLNLGEAYQEQGSPELSLYREELMLRARKNLGLRVFGKYYWHNPCKPPAGYWVTHAKARPKNDAEEILWLAKNEPMFFGGNCRTPYSPSMLRDLKNGPDTRKERPSGHGNSKAGFATDHGGAWPGQTISIPNAASNGPYFEFCRDNGLPTHPARFPEKLAENMILGHTLPGHLICDPFGGCYDPKTEVLTNKGWKFWEDVTGKESFLTRSEKGEIVWQKATELHRYIHTGKMVEIRSRTTDLLVTPNHNMLVRTHGDFCKNRNHRLIPAGSLTTQVYRIPSTGIYKPTITRLSGEEMSLIGLYLSEGHFKNKRRLVISQKDTPKRKEMMGLIKSFNPTPLPGSEKKAFSVQISPELAELIKTECGVGKKNKKVSQEIIRNKWLGRLLQAMILGDGHTEKDGRQRYYTCSKQLADGTATIAALLGHDTHTIQRPHPKKYGKIRGKNVIPSGPNFQITIKRSYEKKIKKEHIHSVDYEGPVYCVTVPNHTLFVRRNGKTSWCGNSGTTAKTAEKLGRKWISGDRELAYALGAIGRFEPTIQA